MHRLERRSLLSAGYLDPSFGQLGSAILPELPEIQPTQLDQIAPSPGGKTVALGNIDSTDPNSPGGGLVRFNIDGTLDSTFGTNGTVTGIGIVQGNAIAVDSLGRIYKLTEAVAPVITRYTSTGALDTGYGTNGTASITLTANQSSPAAFAIVIDSSDRVVIAGSIVEHQGNVSQMLAMLARFTTSGIPDATFGSGGVAEAGLGQFDTLVIDHEGRIIGGGYTGNRQGISSGLVAVRFLSDGSPDLSVGYYGVIPLPANPAGIPSSIFNYTIASAAVDADDRVVLAAQAEDDGVLVTRILPDGTADPTFNNGQFVVRPKGSGAPSVTTVVGVQSDGKVVLLSEMVDADPFELVRLNVDGSLDPTFGTGGSAVAHSGYTSCSMFLDANERVVALVPNGLGDSTAELVRFTSDAPITLEPDGSLVLAGSPNADTISLSVSGSNYLAEVDGTSQSFATASVTRIFAAGRGGDDQITLTPAVAGATLLGGGGADTITGGDGSNSIKGGAGNDSLSGGGGDDTVRGRAGNDTINGGTGDDLLGGGTGDDSILGSNGADTLYGRAGNDHLNGGPGNDVYFTDDGDNADTIIGGGGNDTAHADAMDSVSGVTSVLLT
jgi:uncharacterized delta-60 repeat protein